MLRELLHFSDAENTLKIIIVFHTGTCFVVPIEKDANPLVCSTRVRHVCNFRPFINRHKVN